MQVTVKVNEKEVLERFAGAWSASDVRYRQYVIATAMDKKRIRKSFLLNQPRVVVKRREGLTNHNAESTVMFDVSKAWLTFKKF